jgi:hypothetical protein
MNDTPIILSGDEISALTGGMMQISAQVRDLHAQGFVRARIKRGRVILERAHFEAVCAGRFAKAIPEIDTPRPRVKQVHATAHEAL